MAKFLNQDGLQYFAERLVELVEQKMQINITGVIDGSSTNQQLPGAKAVYDLMVAGLAGIVSISMEVVPSLPSSGESNIIYLVKVSGNTYSQHIYTGDQWFDLGTTEIDLSNYWEKDDLEALSNTEIQDIIDDVLGV
jgi:hypothetical protein